MGTEVVCSRVKALSGTCPPFGNAVVDCAAPNCSGEAGVVACVPPATTPDDPVWAVTADGLVAVLDGPNEADAADPPETPPADAPAIPERIYRSLRFSGLWSKFDCTSR